MRPWRFASAPKGSAFRTLLAGVRISTEEFDSAFAYRIDFSRDDRPGDDVTGAGYIRNNGAAELGLKYFTIPHRRYRIRTEYLTEDAEAQARTKTLLSVIDASFCRGLRVMNLQTGAVMTENLRDDGDKRSYSIALRDEWLEKPERYLFVGQTINDDEFRRRCRGLLWCPSLFVKLRRNLTFHAGGVGTAPSPLIASESEWDTYFTRFK